MSILDDGTLKEVGWKDRQEIPDPMVKDAADQYDEARRILEGQGPDSGVLYPLFNSSIVAVELYLKSLSAKKVYQEIPDSKWSKVHAEPQQAGHKLKQLLDAIPDEFRERLEREFRERCSAELGVILSGYEGLFNQSRYPYEEVHDLARYPLGPLMMLSAFLRDFVAEMVPVQRIHWT
jgi:hypothetical protein